MATSKKTIKNPYEDMNVVAMLWFGNRLMVTQRLKQPWEGYWAVVGGKLEPSDLSIVEGCQREIIEETGLYIIPSELILLDCYILFRADPTCGVSYSKNFIFESIRHVHDFGRVKTREPKKHSPWTLKSKEQALACKDLMPAIRQILEKRS